MPDSHVRTNRVPTGYLHLPVLLANVRFWPENLLQEQDLGYRFLAALFNIFMLVMILISIYSVKVHAG